MGDEARARELPAPLQVLVQGFWDWWDAWVTLTFMNLAWAVSWLTIVLGPPVTLGLYHVANRLAHGENLGFRGLVEGARRYARQSWVWMLWNLGAAVVWYSNWTFGVAAGGGSLSFRQVFALVLGALWCMVQIHALPCLMEQEDKSIALALRNGVTTALAAPWTTVAVSAASAAIAFLTIRLAFPLLLGLPALIVTLGTRAVQEQWQALRSSGPGGAQEG
jgi:hypothetical protein